MRRILGLIFVFALISAESFSAEQTNFQYTRRAVPGLSEARSFEIELPLAKMKLVGAELGPESGPPVILVGGYSTSFPYLRKLARELAGFGARVFLFNPPGQGRGEWASAKDADRLHHGIDGMVYAAIEVRKLVATMTEKPVTLVGHSLGGMQIRLSALGFTYDPGVGLSLSKSEMNLANEQTRLIVPIFSVPLVGEDMWQGVTPGRVRKLTRLAPALADCLHAARCVLPKPYQTIERVLTANYLRLSQATVHSGLFGAEDLDSTELHEMAPYYAPHAVSPQIRDDFLRWTSEQQVTSRRGLDLSALWARRQRSAKAVPTLYVAGQKDNLTPAHLLAAEAALLESDYVEYSVGHLGAFFSKSIPKEIAFEIWQRIKGCDWLLK